LPPTLRDVMTTVGAMSRHARRHGRRFTALVLVLLVGATSLAVAPSAPAAPAAPQTAPKRAQPTIEAARLDLDALPAEAAAPALPEQAHAAAAEPDPRSTTDPSTSDPSTSDPSTSDVGNIPSDETPTTEAPVTESPECLCPGWTRQAALP